MQNNINCPLIGVTAQIDENERRWIRSSYTEAICRAGGVPVFLDYLEDEGLLPHLCGRLDGMLFTGGVDIHPKYYGEDVKKGCGEIRELRDVFELALYRHVKACGMPILGICRGMQVLNVAEGGTLWQDMAGHSDTEHVLHIKKGSMLWKMLGESTVVNSHHHQAIRDVGKGCIVTAAAEDGVIEGIERGGDGFWLGVQWHPELLSPSVDGVFPRFLCACAAYGTARGHFALGQKGDEF